MVSSNRYLIHHKNEAKHIDIILRQFGCSGETPGFWCNKGNHTHISDCITCEQTNYCQRTTPPLERRYDPESNHPWRGDIALLFLMSDRELGNKRDWLWLQHRETANTQEVIQ